MYYCFVGLEERGFDKVTIPIIFLSCTVYTDKSSSPLPPSPGVGNLTHLAMSDGKYPEFERVSVSKDGRRSRALSFWKQKCFLDPSVLSFKFYKIFFLQL